ETAGHRVVSVGSDSEALKVLERAEPVDLAILDFVPNQHDHQHFFERVRALRPQLPIILCTDKALATKEGLLTQTGVHAVLCKPFRMNELGYAVNEALDPDGTAL